MNLEVALRRLGDEIDFPEEPDLAAAVTYRLRADRRHVPLWRRARVVAAAACVALSATFALSSGARTAVADLFGFDGVTLRFVESLPRVDPRADTIVPGRPASLATARTEVPFEVRIPAALGDPDEVYLLSTGTGTAVSLVYFPSPGLPQSGATGVGAILSQFEGALDERFSSKLLEAGESILEPVEVRGEPAYLITGGDHLVTFLGPDGEPRFDEGRLAGNTLLWERDGLVYRLEAEVGRDRAIEIAESL